MRCRNMIDFTSEGSAPPDPGPFEQAPAAVTAARSPILVAVRNFAMRRSPSEVGYRARARPIEFEIVFAARGHFTHVYWHFGAPSSSNSRVPGGQAPSAVAQHV